MTKPDKRSREVLAAARKAVSKIADPTLRAKATAKLDATQKKLANTGQQERSLATKRQRIPGRDRARDLDFDR